jgi:hypothetical protein
LKVLYNSCLKATIWTILNASMWIINQQEKNHFMVCIFGIGMPLFTYHPFSILVPSELWLFDFFILVPSELWLFDFFLIDLQLDVKGCTDVYASFDKYVEVEQLEGDNKYHAEQYGLQVQSITMYFSFWLSGRTSLPTVFIYNCSFFTSWLWLYFQEAKKGVLFIDFPPVLQLQLKRFEYDFVRDTMVKVSIRLKNQ